MNEHERGFLTFLVEPTRRRVEALLELGPKRRGDVRSLLDHAVRIDPSSSRHVTGTEAFAGPIEAALREAGAPASCYVLAADSELDGSEMRLREALEAVVGSGEGAFVSCIPGRLDFYEGGEIDCSYILSR